MLTNDLMRVKVAGKMIAPSFLKENGRAALEKAAGIVEIFTASKGLRRGDLLEAIQEMSSIEVDHKLIKGLGKVAMNSCVFEIPALDVDEDVDAKTVRRIVFERAAIRGPVALEKTVSGRISARDVMAEIAEEMSCEPEQLWSFLYADRREMHTVEQPPKFSSAIELIRKYNLVLCQSLFLYAASMKITLWEPEVKWLRLVFRRLKFYRLMFRVFAFEDRTEIVLDGPQSILKYSNRYGMQFATFFPVVPMLPSKWRIEADILWGKKRKFKKTLILEHTAPLHSHYQRKGLWKPNVEIWFEERFATRESSWLLKDGAAIDLGNQQILIPNYKFQKGEIEVFLDIVGFWRKSYLQNIVKSAPNNVLFAVSKKYAADSVALPKNIQDRILMFSEVIPVSKVIEMLDVAEIGILKNK